MTSPSKVTVMVYRHRHGEDVSVYENAAAAYQAAALDIIVEYLHEIHALDKRQAISKAITEARFADALALWEEAQGDTADPESIEISEDVVVAPARTAADPKCPKCGETDLIEVKETYTAYHPVQGHQSKRDVMPDGTVVDVISPAQTVQVQNALSTGCPSEHFDDGASDFEAHCSGCLHSGTPEEFRLGDPSEWEWV